MTNSKKKQIRNTIALICAVCLSGSLTTGCGASPHLRTIRLWSFPHLPLPTAQHLPSQRRHRTALVIPVRRAVQIQYSLTRTPVRPKGDGMFFSRCRGGC